jgi:hypothetical protein
MTNQEAILAQVIARSGSAGNLDYNGEWHRLWDEEAIDPGMYNERMLAWLNVELVADEDADAPYPYLMQAMEVYAQRAGFANWSSMDALL